MSAAVGPILNEVGRVPGPAKRDGRFPEQEVDIHRVVRFSRAALLRLLDEANHGRVAFRELLLCGQICPRERRSTQRKRHHGQRRQDRSERRSHPPGFDATGRFPVPRSGDLTRLLGLGGRGVLH